MALNWIFSFTQFISSTESATKEEQNKKHHDFFQMPLHYPRYTKSDYENMEEWKLDMLLKQYGLDEYFKTDSLPEKRSFAIGAFLWPDQL